MVQFLISALLVSVFIAVFRDLFICIMNNNPINIKTAFGKWFSIEATFKGETSKTRN